MGRTTPGMPEAPTMLHIPAGEFLMGSDAFYPDEGPPHRVRVQAFELDERPVTNAEFAAFVAATGYLTVAEVPLDPAEFPDLSPRDLAPGGLVFTPSPGPVDLGDWRQWWRWVPGACWQQPLGPGSSIEGREDHPAVQVSFADAGAYAAWAGKRLPDEAEWEFAARGGLSDAFPYAWGDEASPDGVLMANTWQGLFPYLQTGANGWKGTSPAGTFPPNGYGLFDMIGNVWEWTRSYYSPATTRPQEQGPRTGQAGAHAPRTGTRPPKAQSPGPAFHAAYSREAHTCAPRSTACATARQRVPRSPRTRQPRISASGAHGRWTRTSNPGPSLGWPGKQLSDLGELCFGLFEAQAEPFDR